MSIHPNQTEALRLFTALRLIRPDWAGSLLLGVGLKDEGRALALASLAAGAASIFLEDDAKVLRAAQREGCCTFTVTALDEALRILKNEVRQKRAVSVAVDGDASEWMRAMAERGVLPEAIASERSLSAAEESSLTTLSGWGAIHLDGYGFAHAEGAVNLQTVLEGACAGRWQLVEDSAATPAERRAQDAGLLASADGDDAFSEATKVWLRMAPSLFPRVLERATWSRCG